MTKHHKGGLEIQDAECSAMISRDHALFKNELSTEDPTSGEEEIDEEEKQDHKQGEASMA